MEFTGDAFQGQGQNEGGIPPFLLGFIAALLILAVVFRTAGAAALPLASAAAALTAGLGLIGILTHAMDVSNITPQLTELMVIGVGVDYALFIVTRHRRNLRRGMGVRDSIAAAIDTSGRAVLFAGTTVCIAMLGLIALGVGFFYGMAIGTSIAVSLTMLASLTLLPALLSFLGLRVLPRKQRREVAAGHFVDAESTGMWARWAAVVARRPVALAGLGAIVMVALAIPFFAMRLGQADQGNDPSGSTTRNGYDLIAEGFGAGYNSTLSLVVSGPNAQDTARQVGTHAERSHGRRPAERLRAAAGADPAAVDRLVQVGVGAAGPGHHGSGEPPAQRRSPAAVRRDAVIRSTCSGRPRSRSTSPTCCPPRCRCSSRRSSGCRSCCC